MRSFEFFKKVAFLACLLWTPAGFAQHNYNDALKKGVLFFDANRCGPNVATDNVFAWRGACHVNDGSEVGLNLTGGFHDAGDHVKFGLPQTWSAATMGFAFYEFKESFDQAGATPKMLSTLKYFTDFFLKCHPNANTFYYHVGDGHQDHGYWGSPELQSGARGLIAATPATPASDVCGEAAAALALMSLNYRSVDVAYANQCLQAAKEIFALGKNNLGRSSDGAGGSFYKSSSHFDDLSWAAVWLSIATGDASYRAPVDGWLNERNEYNDDNYDKHWAPAWDDVTVYTLIKMFELTGTQKYYQGVINNLEWYRDQCRKTPSGLPWLDSWGVLRYASSEAGVGYLAAKKFEYPGYMSTADLTMNYTLGTNPRNSSYVTGFGTNAPQHPHHRANEPTRGGPTKGIIGALVGGPASDDSYIDDVGNFVTNEVAIDYNAAFILGMAGKVYYTLHSPPGSNLAPNVALSSPSAGQSFAQGAAITLSANASDSDGTISLVEFYVNGAKVGQDNTSPYSISWSSTLAGSYNVTAKAIDNRLGSKISAAVAISVQSPGQPNTPNLALNKPATASSIEAGGTEAALAVDGNISSRWSSLFADPQWLQVDLQTTATINRVILTWEAAAGKTYQIQVSSNGTSWTNVASVVGGDGGIDDIQFPAVQARYVRMHGTERTTPYGFSLYEMAVYGTTGTPVNVAPTVAITSPANGATFTIGTINITATAADSDGTVTKVSFFSGGVLVGEDTSAPYTFAWACTSPSNYSLTAVATDNQGATTTSAPIAITVGLPPVNVAPTVAITSPANGATLTVGNINITATAADSDGTVTKVSFFTGGVLVGEDTSAPYTFVWACIAPTNYSLTAVATDNQGATTTSAPISINVVLTPVNAAPTVTITSPANNASFTLGNPINIAANAADSDGTVVKVAFFVNGTQVGEDTSAPYTFAWPCSAPGNYSLTAVATDNQGATTTSAPIAITVGLPPVNVAPTVAITSPAHNASFTLGNPINIAANAADSDGTVAKVGFFVNGTQVGEDTSAPYTFAWPCSIVGHYLLTAVATDNQGTPTTSFIISIDVTQGAIQTPFDGVIGIPGFIEAENFDNGGEGISFHDTTPTNLSGAYRNTAVDIEPCSETTHNLDFSASGEWTEYSVLVAASGQYRIDTRVASPVGGSFHIEMDGVNVSGAINVPNTGGWQNWVNVAQIVNLTAGSHIMRFFIDQAEFNTNKFTFTPLFTIPTDPTGDGLTAQYFNGQNFTTSVLTRKDANINFNWGLGSPAAGVNVDGYSVRWTGQIKPRNTGTYTFHITSDNGRRVWVNNVLIIDKWVDDWDVEYTGTIALTADQKVNIKVEYFENFGGANAKLEWSGAGQAREVIPQSQLFSTTAARRGVEEMASAVSLKLAPNPASEFVNLAWEGVGEGAVTLSIVNAQGNQVHQQVVEGASTHLLNTAHLSSGLYIIRLQAGQLITNKKLFIQH
ncbi:MAG: glycoside hydrolase family 9 protein [Bacteroidota bacterium]